MKAHWLAGISKAVPWTNVDLHWMNRILFECKCTLASAVLFTGRLSETSMKINRVASIEMKWESGVCALQWVVVGFIAYVLGKEPKRILWPAVSLPTTKFTVTSFAAGLLGVAPVLVSFQVTQKLKGNLRSETQPSFSQMCTGGLKLYVALACNLIVLVLKIDKK